MSAPTLAATVEAVARAIFLANPLSNKSMVDAGWDLYEKEAQAAVTATLAALEPLATEWEADAKEYDQRADEAFSDGGRDIAANVYRANANTNARHALQLRDVIGGVKS